MNQGESKETHSICSEGGGPRIRIFFKKSGYFFNYPDENVM